MGNDMRWWLLPTEKEGWNWSHRKKQESVYTLPTSGTNTFPKSLPSLLMTGSSCYITTKVSLTLSWIPGSAYKTRSEVVVAILCLSDDGDNYFQAPPFIIKRKCYAWRHWSKFSFNINTWTVYLMSVKIQFKLLLFHFTHNILMN